MTTAVDTNVLLDVVSNDPSFGQDASDALYAAIVAGAVMICPVVYAELAVSFLADPPALDRFLHQLGIRVDAFARDALRQAAAAWTTYLRTRGQEAQCPHCGARAKGDGIAPYPLAFCPTWRLHADCRHPLWKRHT
jgi:predicted nucleic acid-binding protein